MDKETIYIADAIEMFKVGEKTTKDILYMDVVLKYDHEITKKHGGDILWFDCPDKEDAKYAIELVFFFKHGILEKIINTNKDGAYYIYKIEWSDEEKVEACYNFALI